MLSLKFHFDFLSAMPHSLSILALLLLPIPTHAILRLKFQHWFPRDASYWETAASKCSAELNSYFLDNRTVTCPTSCSCAADCILDNVPGTLESNLASVQVLLCLAPAVLIFFGLSIAEVAVVSTRRPLLTTLIALGCPPSYIARVFSPVDLREP